MSNKELSLYILEQLSPLENIRSIAMMGGYIFYYNERIFGGIYPDGFLVKITKASEKYLDKPTAQAPYQGAKPMFLANDIIDDSQKLCKMVKEMYVELPERKVKKGKKKNEF